MIENPFSDWFTEPAPLSKKLFALTALSWLGYLAIALAQPSHLKASDLENLPTIRSLKDPIFKWEPEWLLNLMNTWR